MGEQRGKYSLVLRWLTSEDEVRRKRLIIFMGFKGDSKAVQCPYFNHVTKTTKGQFIGIECQMADQDIGFEMGHVYRFRNSTDLKDFMEIFCEDMFATCPYYQYWVGKNN